MAKDRAAPTIVVYGLADARAAAAAAAALDVPVTLLVPATVAAGFGADVVASLFALLRTDFPNARITTAVDCADAAGLATALLRRGIDRVRVDGSPEMLERIADVAARGGASLDDEAADALDLLAVDDAGGACEAWLEGFKSRLRKPNCQ